MSLARYALIVVLTVTLSSLLLSMVAGPALGDAGLRATLFGGALAAVNTLVAFGLLRFGEKRSTKVFLGAVLGGMVGRMAVMLAAVVAAILYLGLPRVPLAVSLLSYFVLFLILELRVVHKHTTPQAAR